MHTTYMLHVQLAWHCLALGGMADESYDEVEKACFIYERLSDG